MFVDLDWPLNASSPLSASAELLVFLHCEYCSSCCWWWWWWHVTETSLRERMEGCLHMPPAYDTVVCRAQLALVCSDVVLLCTVVLTVVHLYWRCTALYCSTDGCTLVLTLYCFVLLYWQLYTCTDSVCPLSVTMSDTDRLTTSVQYVNVFLFAVRC